jgi:hypothetical protein
MTVLCHEAGHDGVAAACSKGGDSVGFFVGCRIPYVLRPFGEVYRILGDAYLHGVMDGKGESSEEGMLRIM